MKAKRILRICAPTLAALLSAALGAHGQTLNVLHSFARDDGGYYPEGSVTIGPSGDLYGTTTNGGASGFGVAYELTPPTSPGGEWTERVLHTFSANGGGPPTVGLLLAPSGKLYGATGINGAGGYGTVFELKPPAGTGAHWRETTIHTFTDSDGDGAQPQATPIFGPHGVLYGTASEGGTGPSGAVYQLSPPGANGGTWTESVLYDFQGKLGDGVEPIGPLALDGGTIYGGTEYGGAGAGTVFQLTPPTAPGGNWTETLLYSFQGGDDSAYPNGVVLGPGGVLYGTTFGNHVGDIRACDTDNYCGTVFQLSPPASPGGPWTKTILHTFTSGTGDGWLPNSTPVLGPNGVLYGTTTAGGAGSSSGAIYEMVPPSSPGQAWTEVILYSFPQSGAEGEGPNAVTLGPDGNLYGTTEEGGAHNQGTVFQLVLQ